MKWDYTEVRDSMRVLSKEELEEKMKKCHEDMDDLEKKGLSNTREYTLLRRNNNLAFREYAIRYCQKEILEAEKLIDDEYKNSTDDCKEGTNMNITKYLKEKHKSPIPNWLKEYKHGDYLDLNIVFNSNALYYPGAGFDGHPIETCSKSHFSYVYVYADYGVNEELYDEEMKLNGFKGYHSLGKVTNYDESFFINKDDRYSKLEAISKKYWRENCNKGVIIEVFERNQELDESYGVERFVFIYLINDGIKVYDDVFASKKIKPGILLIQDHGRGGNYNVFGREGLLEKIAIERNNYPLYIIFGTNTLSWYNYRLIKHIDPEYGGMHNHERRLFHRVISTEKNS